MAESKPARVWPYFVVCAVMAAWLAPSQVNELHSADSVLFQLQSRFQWMPYLWEQDRIGMLWPLLTKPIVHPFANLLVQTGITIFCGLAFPYVFLRILSPTVSVTPAALAYAWLAVAAPDIIFENLFVVCQYPSALFLGGCGLLVLTPTTATTTRGQISLRKFLLGVFLLALAHWVYIAVVFVLFPLAVFQFWCRRGVFELNRIASFAVLVAFAFGFGLMQFVRGRYPGIDVTPTKLNSLGTIPFHARQFLIRLAEPDNPTIWLPGTVTIFFATVVLFLAVRKRVLPINLRVAIGCLGIAGIEWVVVSSLAWPCEMYHNPRYVLVTLMGFLLAMMSIIIAVFPATWQRRISIVSTLLLAVALIFRFGPPSVSAVRADFDLRFGQHTNAYLESGADSISEEYWSLWTAVYHLELVRYERGLPPLNNVVGVRSAAFWPTWRAVGPNGFVVAAPRPVAAISGIAGEERGLAPFTFIREHGPLNLYRTRYSFAPYPGKPTDPP